MSAEDPVEEDEPCTIRMVQDFPARWHIESHRGFILEKDITCSNITEALEYIRKYASSFNWWTYEVVPIKDFNKKR